MEKQKLKRSVDHTIKVGRREARPDGKHQFDSFTTVPDGTLTAEVVVEIDMDALVARMGSRAMLAKTNKSVALNGIVVVRARNFRRDGAGPVDPWIVTTTTRANAGGTLYQVEKLAAKRIAFETPTHSEALARQEADRLNAIEAKGAR